MAAAADALAAAGLAARDLEAIGITNQRETTLLWDRGSGTPLSRAIVWQDRRTADACRQLPAELLRERTGLLPDPYFSATKLAWLLEHVAEGRDGLAFGTVDSWLVWRLTGGEVHATDPTNASRTLLWSLQTWDWDDELLALFRVPRDLLPQIVPSSGPLGEARLFGAAVAGGRHRRRPAGRALRPGLPAAGPGQGHLRHRQLPAGERRRAARPAPARAGANGRRPARRDRARGLGVRGRGGAAVATRRARADGRRGRQRTAGALGRKQRRCPLRARPDRARLALVGCQTPAA